MRSRFHMMFVATGFVVLMLVLFMAGATSSIAAQGAVASPTVTATPSVMAVGASNNHGAFLTRVSDTLGLPSSSVFDISANTASDISLDTQTTLGVDCANVVVYRETELGDLVIHPSSCSGNLLTFQGTGGNFQVDYFVAWFGTTSAAKSAPVFVVRNLGVQSLPILGGGILPENSSTSAATMPAMPTATSTP